MGLRSEIVDLVWLRLLHDANEVGRIGHVAVVQDELLVRLVRVLIEMLDATRVEGRRPALDPVDRVALLQQELRKIGAVLAGRTGNQGNLSNARFFHVHLAVDL